MRRGRRPSFQQAMPPELAEEAYRSAVAEARALGVAVETGRFRADMRVESVNEGAGHALDRFGRARGAPRERAEGAAEP